ncbi:Glycosyltransferase involved in cell wall bisynthesis [Sporobacter termitidis DSM 10068]|uniref:Glycosyltransferase involved in cell wall bisynthesis n=1 Tax=Sporobacter termitidis DSM 10068 TaxID=1123282 RepID=A0A1M5WX64_9FIRM|nr:glycosyltransferase family 4 protein [Sporobacter termitidis]SHH92137.1 Glycosyltransferase involved in cell wall bisynthesis [Sporobacter termitidis DSM 10068]
MVKVLNVISDTNIGGAGRVILNYLKYSDRASFDTAVCLPRGSLLAAPLRDAGAGVYELDISPDKSFDRGDIRKLRQLIRELDPDIVHTHGSLSGRIAGRRCGKTVIYTRHSVFPVSPRIRSGPGHLLNKLVNEHYADRIIAVSQAAKENLTDGGISAGLIDVVINGVEPVSRVSGEERRLLRARYGIGEDDFACGIIARIEPYKGHMIILDAAKILRDEGRSVKVAVAGTGSFEEEVRKRAAELGLQDNVIFLGFVSDVAPVYGMLDAQLNASYGTEATSLSLLEGMSAGLPAIVSDYGGNPYIIEHEKNGLVFKSMDSRGLADQIRRLMSDPALYAKLAENAPLMYSARYTGKIFAENIEAVYQKALKGVNDGK